MESPDSPADSDQSTAEVQSGNNHEQLRFFDIYVRHLFFMLVAAIGHGLGTLSGSWFCWGIFGVAAMLLAVNCQPVARDLIWLWHVSPLGRNHPVANKTLNLFAGALAGISISSAIALSGATRQVLLPG